jgi:hypothetical protein
MNKTGLSRPGAMLMVMSAVLTILVGVGPLFMAATRPSHEWLMVLTGLPAFMLSISGLFVTILYFIGFLKCGASKGYSAWLSFWLFWGNVPGFIVLLLLPDLNARNREPLQTTSKPCELSPAGG